jgi:hypothetical protein
MNVKPKISFDPRHFPREFAIFDHRSEPRGIVPGTQVILPGRIVNLLSELQKVHKVGRTKINSASRAAKIETLAHAPITYGVFARMPFVRLPWRSDLKRSRWLPGPEGPVRGLIITTQMFVLVWFGSEIRLMRLRQEMKRISEPPH